MDSQHSFPASQRGINTLAQTGTTNNSKTPILLTGNGSELANTKTIQGRAKRKMITQTMVLRLIDVVEKKGKKREQTKGYWNTYHCQNKVYTVEGRMYGKYCKNRACTLCCSIRKAEIINKYLPVIKTWSEPYLVTLSVKAVPKKWLRMRLRNVLRAFNEINDMYRKRNQRGHPVRLVGIKSLECNFNPEKKTYNPHLHLIVPNKEIADILIKEWLKKWTPKFASPKAQHSSLVYNKEKALIEVIKYGSKIFTEPDVNNKSNSIVNRTIHAAALNNIFSAMKGLRIFERFGFDLPKQENKQDTKMMQTSAYNAWVFDPKAHDWINTINDESLTDYEPEYALLDLLGNRIDTKLQ